MGLTLVGDATVIRYGVVETHAGTPGVGGAAGVGQGASGESGPPGVAVAERTF